MESILAGFASCDASKHPDCGFYPCPIMGGMPLPTELPCRAMTHEDLPHVLALQYSCYHPDLHEPLSAFESKLSASPDTCWVISAGPAAIQAYLVCLPIADENYPLLHAPDWQPPMRADELYVHDMAISPLLRGQGASRQLLRQAITHATRLGLARLSLIAVQDSAAFWGHLGFAARPVTSAPLARKLASFGADAMLMSHNLPQVSASA